MGESNHFKNGTPPSTKENPPEVSTITFPSASSVLAYSPAGTVSVSIYVATISRKITAIAVIKERAPMFIPFFDDRSILSSASFENYYIL
jgi:hypothetical protein